MPVSRLAVSIVCLSVVSLAFGEEPALEPTGMPLQVPAGAVEHYDPALQQTGFFHGPTIDQATPEQIGVSPIHTVRGMKPIPSQEELPPIPESWLMSYWDPQPRIEVRGDAVFLQPNMYQSVRLATQSGSNITTKLNQGFQTSGRGEVEVHMNHIWSLQGSVLYMDGPISNNVPLGNTTSGAPILISQAVGGPLYNLPATFPTTATSMNMNWRNELFNSDAHLLCHYIPIKGPANEFVYGVGARYMAYNERVTVNYNNATTATTGQLYSVSENSMIGPQFLFRGRVNGPGPRLRLVSEAKIALLSNFVDDRTSTYTSAIGQTGSARYSRTQFASVYEGNFLVEFFVIRHMCIFGGFQIFYMDRVDRASGQFNANVATFTSQHKSIGDSFMYGPRAGVVLSY